MAGDLVRWQTARIAVAGDAGLSPRPGSRGRFFDLRLVWASVVHQTLNRASLLRAAGVSAAIKPERAIEFLKQAEEIELFGKTPDKEERRQQASESWKQISGLDLRNPQDSEKFYKAIAQYRRNEIEAAALAAKAQNDAAMRARNRRKKSVRI